VSGPHRIVNPESLAPPVGFSHAVIAAPGRHVFLGGQTAHGPDGRVHGTTVVEQFDRAAANLVTALAAADALPEHLVSLQIFVTDASEYRGSLPELGEAYRRHFGRHYPALALLEVTELFDPEAKLELVAEAVVPG
jgi:enamine deaminase RidA (YjgF/YER057c/UK114 family)